MEPRDQLVQSPRYTLYFRVCSAVDQVTFCGMSMSAVRVFGDAMEGALWKHV